MVPSPPYRYPQYINYTFSHTRHIHTTMAPNVSSPVLVTGVTGFVGAHVALELLSRGYKVRGTMRNVSKANSLRELPHFTKYIESGQLSFVEVPDVGKGDFTDAMKGVEWVMHIASPFSLSADNG